jgi:uncharacterized protein (TIGR00251 family)
MIISLQVTPKSAKSELLGWGCDAEGRPVLKVKVAAPPEDGKANHELIRFLARHWGVSRTSLEIVSGDTSRHKRLKIHDSVLASQLATQPK